jgi:hypothetical protein
VDPTRSKSARDNKGDELFPTEAEAERRARADAEAERRARAEAESEIARLRAQIERLEGRRRK